MLNNYISHATEEDELNGNENGALLRINVRLSGDKSSTLTIYENDIIEDKVEAFCKEHHLNEQIRDMLNHQVITQLDSQITELEESEKQSLRPSQNREELCHQSFSSFGNVPHNEAKITGSNKLNSIAKAEEAKSNISDDSYSETITPKYIIQDTDTTYTEHCENNKTNSYCIDSLDSQKEKELNNTNGKIKMPKKDVQKPDTIQLNNNKTQIESKLASKEASINPSPSKKVLITNNPCKPPIQSKAPITPISQSRSKSKDHCPSNISSKLIPNVIPIKTSKPLKGHTTPTTFHSPQKKVIPRSPTSHLPQALPQSKLKDKSMSKSKTSRSPIKSQTKASKNNKANKRQEDTKDDRIEIIKMKIIKYREIFDMLDSDKDGVISLKSIRLSILNKDLLQAFTPILEDLQKNGGQMEFKEFCLKVDKFLTMKALSS